MKVTVIGSSNVDTTLTVERIPRPGETVLARQSAHSAGGKGLNQAVAARRAGAEVSFVSAIGSDRTAGVITDALEEAAIDSARVRLADGPTGSAIVLLQDDGENSIVVLAGANAELATLTAADRAAIRQSAVVLCQLEVPLTIVREAAEEAREAGAIFVLNPSPVQKLHPDFLEAIDVIVANEHEAASLALEALNVACVITTYGSRGAVVRRRGHPDAEIPARPARVVDTTGAGDTFVGTVVAELARGTDIVGAARRASVAGSLAVERLGAVPSIPSRDDVSRAMASALADPLDP